MVAQKSKISKYVEEWNEIFQDQQDKRTKESVFAILTDISNIEKQIESLEIGIQVLKEKKADLSKELKDFDKRS